LLVYGDPKFEAPLDGLRRQLCVRVRQALEHPNDLDRLRALLIACGQVEQGATDALEALRQPDAHATPVRQFHQATTYAAEAFYSLAHKSVELVPPPVVDARAALGQLLQCLGGIDNLPGIVATVKLPEGFNLHAMYPEQYAAAAGRWLENGGDRRAQTAVVVGIRSIGTTLAAVVATVLRAGGWQVQSLTVRPRGHPYARTVELEELQLPPSAMGLVVDEGPGISGSSMAATAAALVRAGLAPESIAFLPGHANEPGGAGAPEVQRWWQSAPRYVVGSEQLTFDGLPLPQALAAPFDILPRRIDNVSGGVWRHHVYTKIDEWPPICNGFERVKYLSTGHDGSRVLFKFLGLAANSPLLTSTAESAATLLHRRAEEGLAPKVLGTALGFVATEWVEGIPLGSMATPGDLAAQLGAYIAHVVGPELSAGEMTEAVDRLSDMIYVNTAEACGEEVAGKVRRLRPSAGCPRATYGDGHLQPYEWIRVSDGEARKVDGVGHDYDHTLVGRQPAAWDIAGATIEWALESDAAARLLQAYAAAGGPAIDDQTLAFYTVAYLAFRAGQCALAAQVHDPYERDRLLAAYAAYRARLLACVG
jgi:hypothetical protein